MSHRQVIRKTSLRKVSVHWPSSHAGVSPGRDLTMYQGHQVTGIDLVKNGRLYVKWLRFARVA
jgi:hypothetical protein